MFRQPTETCPPPWRTSCSKESEVSECWSANTLDTDCLVSRLKVGNYSVFYVFICFLTQGTLCCFDGCADVCLPPTESCRQVIFNPWIKKLCFQCRFDLQGDGNHRRAKDRNCDEAGVRPNCHRRLHGRGKNWVFKFQSS